MLKKCTRCKKDKEANTEVFPPHNKTKSGLDSWCRECRSYYRSSLRSTLDGYIDELGKWRKGAKYLGKFKDSYKLTFEQKKLIWEKQNGKCAISGVQMTHLRGQKKVMTNASVDRIDSSRGYDLDNVQLVCWCVNRMKGEMSEDELIKWCKKIIQNNKQSN